MTTKSVATKAAPSIESKGIPLWIARAAILLVILAVLCLYLQTPSIWLFYKTQSIYGDLIAPLFFFFISLALLRNLWENRDKDKNDRVRRVVGLAVFGFFLVIGLAYSLASQSFWSYRNIKGEYGGLISLLFAVFLLYEHWQSREKSDRVRPVMGLLIFSFFLAIIFLYFLEFRPLWLFSKTKDEHGNLLAFSFFALLLYGIWRSIEKSNERQWVVELIAFAGLIATDFIYLMKAYMPVFFTAIHNNGKYFIAPMFLLLAPAPLSLYLWLCRNEDKLEQIKQSDEQNRFSNFSNAIRLFLENSNKHANAAGLRILAKIKNEGSFFHTEIDMATPGVDLKNIDLIEANLANINLSRAKLKNARMNRANMTGVDLTDADLSGATLTETNLTDVNFTKTNIKKAHVGVYKEFMHQEFSREEIEKHLQKDWKTEASKKNFDFFLPILIRRDKENREIYYFIEKRFSPSSAPRPDDSHDPDPKPSRAPDGDTDPYKIGSEPLDDSTYVFDGTIDNAPLHNAVDYCNRGLAKMKAEDYDGAISDFSDAINLDPNKGPARRYRGVARMRKSRRGKK